MPLVIEFKKLTEKARLPTKKTSTDVGWDLYSAVDVVIPAGDQRIINTGLQLANTRYEGDSYTLNGSLGLFIWPRSGLDSKYGLHTGAGVIDQGYRGEILVLLKNMGDKEYTVHVGDKIAQFVPLPVPETVVRTALFVTETERGSSGGISEPFYGFPIDDFGPVECGNWESVHFDEYFTEQMRGHYLDDLELFDGWLEEDDPR